jgi:hypothetical protein
MTRRQSSVRAARLAATKVVDAWKALPCALQNQWTSTKWYPFDDHRRLSA